MASMEATVIDKYCHCIRMNTFMLEKINRNEHMTRDTRNNELTFEDPFPTV